MTTEEAMTIDEHVRTALAFLEHSDREFAAGDILQGSEKLWGAASHAVMALAMERGWRFGQHQALKDAAETIAQERNDPLLASNFSVAEKFHANFYHDFMEDHVIERDRPKVRGLVHSMLELVNPDR